MVNYLISYEYAVKLIIGTDFFNYFNVIITFALLFIQIQVNK